MKWYCYGCGRTQPRIDVDCRCEWWKRKGPWLREMLNKLIQDISPEDTPFICKPADVTEGPFFSNVEPNRGDPVEPVQHADG